MVGFGPFLISSLKGNIRITMEAAEGIERCSGGFVVEIRRRRQDDNAVVDECSRWGTGQAENPRAQAGDCVTDDTDDARLGIIAG